jgi:hypothetical protein
MDVRERISKLVQAQWKLEAAKDLISAAIQGDSGDELCEEIDSLIISLNVDIDELHTELG